MKKQVKRSYAFDVPRGKRNESMVAAGFAAVLMGMSFLMWIGMWIWVAVKF